ncbi:MAG: hypothetical protein JST86_13630 [Bacteroidetes bacterium]|nr:hypothetical protein [Bacteroidota bacterium]
MTVSKTNRLLLICISAVCVLLCVLPYSQVFIHDKSAALPNSSVSFILADKELLLIYGPFFILWLAYLLVKKFWLKKLLHFILLGLSFFYFLLAFESFMLMVKSSSFSVALVLTIVLFPLMVMLSVHKRIWRRESAVITAE